MKRSICCISALLMLGYPTLAGAMTREELRARTEEMIRSERQRRTRLQKETLLDNQGHLYSDGLSIYLGILIHNKIFPAVKQFGDKQPACLFEERLIAGTYNADEDKVICLIGPGKFRRQSGQEILAKNINNKENKKENKKASPQQPPAPKKSLVRARPRASKSAQAVELNPFSSRQKFGIHAGTWARVFLPRTVSSSETAEIELELITDLTGSQRTLPAKSIFFARHRINPLTQRLDMDLSLMVLPTGEEFSVVGTVHGSNKEAGLAGTVITHSDRIANIAIRSGILGTTSNELTKQLSPEDPLTALAGDVATEVLNANRRALPQSPGFSLEILSGEAWVRFGRSF